MLFLKQSTSVTVQFGPFVDAGDGVTLETGLATAMDNATTGIRISKNGAAMIDRNSATVPAYDAMGFYRINLSTTDTNTLGTLLMVFEEAATTLPGWMEFMVLPANVYDSLVGGTDTLDANVTEWLGTAAATPTVAGVPEVDATHWRGTAIVAPAVAGTPDVSLVAAGVDLIWDEPMAGHSTADTSGLVMNDWQDGGRLDLILDARMAEASINTTGGAVDTVTAVTNAVTLPTIPANWITAAGINAAAMNGKGDWNIGKTGYSISGTITTLDGLNDLTAAQVNAEVLDVLNTDTFAEPAQGAPAATTTLVDKIGYLYKTLRNKKTATATTISIFNDDTTTVDHKRTISDDGTTYTEEEIVTGP